MTMGTVDTVEMAKPGLEGVVAGETALSTIEGGLCYRGYAVGDLVINAGFDEVEIIAERIRRTVAEGVIRIGDTELGITVSVGGARVDEVRQIDSMDRLMNEADKWLYEAKRNGRNRCICRPLEI